MEDILRHLYTSFVKQRSDPLYVIGTPLKDSF